MAGIHYLSFIPAENPAHRGQGVNLLLMVDNQGEDAAVTVRFYGSDGSDWREIFAEERSFQGHSHIHAYFHLPPACFAPESRGFMSTQIIRTSMLPNRKPTRTPC